MSTSDTVSFTGGQAPKPAQTRRPPVQQSTHLSDRSSRSIATQIAVGAGTACGRCHDARPGQQPRPGARTWGADDADRRAKFAAHHLPSSTRTRTRARPMPSPEPPSCANATSAGPGGEARGVAPPPAPSRQLRGAVGCEAQDPARCDSEPSAARTVRDVPCGHCGPRRIQSHRGSRGAGLDRAAIPG